MLSEVRATKLCANAGSTETRGDQKRGLGLCMQRWSSLASLLVLSPMAGYDWSVGQETTVGLDVLSGPQRGDCRIVEAGSVCVCGWEQQGGGIMQAGRGQRGGVYANLSDSSVCIYVAIFLKASVAERVSSIMFVLNVNFYFSLPFCYGTLKTDFKNNNLWASHDGAGVGGWSVVLM